MSRGASSKARNFSIPGAGVTGANQVLFPDAAYNSMEERWINNPSSSATIWVNLFGGSAAANTEGSFAIPPLGAWSGKVANAIYVLGVAGQAITAGER